MVRRGGACDRCTKNCHIFHQNQKDQSPIITRFFKIVFGKDYSEVLYLPPEFARTVRHLASQETKIEDSGGLQWSVTLSYVNGSLAFQKGWHKFFLDHGLEKGQFLVFNYIMGSHFIVQIYGRSACERINFNNGRPQRNKRYRRDLETVSQDELFRTTVVNSRDKPNSATSVASESEFQNCVNHLAVANADFGRLHLLPRSMNMEDPTCMINRDDGCYQGEDRNFLYDLSSFEVEQKSHDANKLEKDLDTKTAPSHPEFLEHANKFEKLLGTKVTPSCTEIMERAKTKEDDSQMAVIHTDQVNDHSGDIFTNKFEKALYTKVVPCHTDVTEKSKTKGDGTEMAVVHTNQINCHSGDIFMDKYEKALETKLVPSPTEITEQPETKGDDSQMAVAHTNQINGHSRDICTDKLHAKPSGYSDFSKDMSNDVSNFQNGNNHVLASDSESPSIGTSKIAEREYAVKRRCCESSVSSSVLKDSFGKHDVKKEGVDLGEKANGCLELSSDAGKEPVLRKHGQMFSPAVKVEPDLSYDTVTSVSVSPFSAEVKSQSYLELPVHLPTNPGRRERGRGKVVYLKYTTGRLWPVLYCDKFSVKALTGNWSKFCEQNNIKPGDECRFQVESVTPCTFRVDVTHRFGEFPVK